MRTCGKCSLCCKVMGVPEIKPDHEWCQYCKPGVKGGGCTIYESRPQRCRDFLCQWRLDPRFGEHWYPAKAKIVVDTTLRAGKLIVVFSVDPDWPSRWREEPWFSDIKKIAKAGLGGKWTTVVLVKGERIVVGP